MRRFGLIGFPVSHSKSPELFREAYPDTRDMSYELIDEPDFDRAMQRFKEDFDAVNVTAPFKELAFAAADRVDGISSKIGAVNILKKQDELIFGYNSDYMAVGWMLNARSLSGRKALVVGCGGAAKAAAVAAVSAGLEVDMANRDYRKAENFASSVTGIKSVTIADALESKSGYDVVIYAVPVYIAGIEALLSSETVVIEANYRDPSLKDICSSAGSDYVSGIEWLCRQAVAGFRLMTSMNPDGYRMERHCASI